MTLPNLNFPAILPEIVLVAAAILILLLDINSSPATRRALGWLSLLSVLVTLAVSLVVVPADPNFQQMALADGLTRVLGAAVLIAAALAVLLSMDRTAEYTRWIGAYYALLLLATAGMRVMVMASDFMTIFVGLEILSLALYVLVGFNRSDPRSAEASLKYFLLGAFASGFFLYGIALVYSATGSTSLAALNRMLQSANSPLPGIPLLPIGMGMLIVGFGFKLALVPFHMWTPDVYQGAPTALTAFMSVSTKAAAFGAFIRVLFAITPFSRPWLTGLAVLAALTMTLGNLAALRQSSLKRMLAYSSIAHAGYVLTALAANNAQGIQGAVYYLLAYTFMNVGAFAVVLAVQRRCEMDVTNDRLTGLAGRQPGLAALMAIFMFSLTGIPPLAGFFGKLYVFSAAVQAGMAWLAIVAMLNSAIGAYYYLRVTVAMYMAEPQPEPVDRVTPVPATTQPARGARPVERPARIIAGERAETEPALPPVGPDVPTTWPVWTALGLTAIGTVLLGLWQAPWMQTISQAAAVLAQR